VRKSFALDTCSPDDVQDWSSVNASRGHCAVASLTLHDFFGGELLCAEVRVGARRTGYHWWNRVGQFEIDLTRDQFAPTELVGEPWAVDRPVGEHLYSAQHEVFRARVLKNLRLEPTEMGTL
jgi:hypothetical protein